MTFAAFSSSITWAIPVPTPPATVPAWQTTLSLTDFSSPEQTDILNALAELYANSATARDVMDDLVASGLPLRFGEHSVPGETWVSLSGGGSPTAMHAGYNLSKIDDLYYINEDGKAVKEILGITLIHELIHLRQFIASQPYDDPDDSQLNVTNYDQDGDILPTQNTIVQEMATASVAGWEDNTQASYHANLLDTDTEFGTDIIANKDYTFGNAIDNVRFGTNSADDLDHSSNTINLVDLMFGFDGVDEIRAGDGDDYVYGGDDGDEIYGDDGDDTLFGEAGNDLIEGDDGNDFLDGGAVAVSGTNTLDGGAGFDIAFFSASVAAVNLDLTGVAPSHDSADNTTISIEGFVLTAFDDVVDFSSPFNSIVALGDGEDILNILLPVAFGGLIVGLGDGADTLNWQDDGGGVVFAVDGDADDIIMCNGVNIADVIGRATATDSDDGYMVWYVIDGNNNELESLTVSCDVNGAYIGYLSLENGYSADLLLGRFDDGDFGITTGFSSDAGDLRASFEAFLIQEDVPADMIDAAVGNDYVWELLAA